MMEVRHDTKLLQEAVELVIRRASISTKQAEAEALRIAAEALARRRLYTGLALGVAAIGVGLGVMFGNWKHVTHTETDLSHSSIASDAPIASAPHATSEPLPKESSNPVSAPEKKPGELEKIPDQRPPVVNFTKFAERTVDLFGREWSISAGHQYNSDADKEWNYAWCYSNPIVGGLPLKLDLASRQSPSVRPLAPLASTQTLTQVGLNDATARVLASKCPWLDGAVYSPDDFSSPAGRYSAPTGDASVPATDPPQAQQLPIAPVTPTNPMPVPPPVVGSSSLPQVQPQPQPNLTPEGSLDLRTVPPSDGNDFVASDGFDLPGNDLPGMPIAALDQSECEADCTRQEECTAYTFNKQFAKCFLKTGKATPVPNGSAFSGYRGDLIPTPPILAKPVVRSSGQRMLSNQSLDGDVLGRSLAVRNSDCVSKCDSDERCTGFSYWSAERICVFYGSVARTVYSIGATSGVKPGG